MFARSSSSPPDVCHIKVHKLQDSKNSENQITLKRRDLVSFSPIFTRSENMSFRSLGILSIVYRALKNSLNSKTIKYGPLLLRLDITTQKRPKSLATGGAITSLRTYDHELHPWP